MPNTALQNTSNGLLALVWLLSLASIFIDAPALKTANGAVLALYIVLVAAFIRRSLQILCIALAATTAAISWYLDGWYWAWAGVEKAVLFSAFFGTLSLLRATADRRPEIARARQSVEKLTGDERDSGLLAGTFVLGSTLIVGVMAIFSPIVGRDAPFEIRKSAAEASQRGMCLACLWSPFWVAMAVSSEHLPDVPLWQVMAAGLALSAIGLVTAQMIYTPRVGLAGLGRALAAFGPVIPPVALAAAAVLGLKAATPFTTLQCLVLGIPVLCLATLAASGLRHLTAGIRQSGQGLGAVRGEIVLLTCSFALGRVLQVALEAGGAGDWVTALAPPPVAIIAASVAIMSLLAFVGIHQIVTLTVVLVTFGSLSLGVDHLALMQAGLLGWAFASMIGLSAVSVAAAGTMYNVPLERIAYGPNVKFVAVFGIIGTGWIALLNVVLT